MDIVTTGLQHVSLHEHRSKIPRLGTTLYAGSLCNDGRPITESWKYKEAVKKGIPIVRPKGKPPVGKLEKIKEKKELLVDKYKPVSIKDIIGHKEHISQISLWLSSWNAQKKEEKGLLITGPPGIGKTTTVHLIAASLGYKVTEYNASDTRSVSLLKGMFALGMKRLQKEVIVMDEVDGLSGGGERGGVGEIADIIRKTNVPILCIANELPPKLKPLQNASLCIKLHRPVKSTIATAVYKIAQAEGIAVSKVELEELCEKNSNDIRSILNALDFYRNGLGEASFHGQKDGLLRLDLFSATQKLMAQKRLGLHAAEDLVYVDYNMIPLMVQEAYLSSAASMEEVEAASEMISYGDTIPPVLWKTQDWTLLPLMVHTTVAVSKTVSGPAPFQIFPQLLGKMSKKSKHARYIEELARKERCSSAVMRLDKACAMERIMVAPLLKEKPDIKDAIKILDERGWSRDDLLEHLPAVLSEPMEIPTKVKTALTREYNKTHGANTSSISNKKRKALSEPDMDGTISEVEDDLEEIRDELEAFEI